MGNSLADALRRACQRAGVALLAGCLFSTAAALAVDCPEDPAACACQKPCSLPGKGVRRTPNLLPGFPEIAAWDLGEMPPAGSAVRIRMEYDQWFQLCDRAVDTWSSISDSLPDDYVLELGPGYFLFQWHWASLAEVRAFGPLGNCSVAATLTYFGDATYPCRITATDIIFAYDPQTTSGTYVYWSTDCAPSCGVDELDYLSGAVHEYGHALGLDHTLDTQATMFARIAINDSVSKTLSACDIGMARSIYRDNFGPATVDSFEIRADDAGTVACAWTARLGEKCRQYRVTKVCSDGLAFVVADSVACHGGGVPYAVTDESPCSGLSRYVLSAIDSIGPGGWQEVMLDERVLNLGVEGQLP